VPVILRANRRDFAGLDRSRSGRVRVRCWGHRAAGREATPAGGAQMSGRGLPGTRTPTSYDVGVGAVTKYEVHDRYIGAFRVAAPPGANLAITAGASRLRRSHVHSRYLGPGEPVGTANVLSREAGSRSSQIRPARSRAIWATSRRMSLAGTWRFAPAKSRRARKQSSTRLSASSPMPSNRLRV
jgi:hypothetical protein